MHANGYCSEFNNISACVCTVFRRASQYRLSNEKEEENKKRPRTESNARHDEIQTQTRLWPKKLQTMAESFQLKSTIVKVNGGQIYTHRKLMRHPFILC